MVSIDYRLAKFDWELEGILELQCKNFETSVSVEEKIQEGFLTVRHDFKMLETMNRACPHTIAVFQNRIIGYALSMTQEFRDEITILKPMFDEIDRILEQPKDYLVMGQICIDKSFRKQGVFRGMYAHMKQNFEGRFDRVITEVDKENIRSLNAHYAVGFSTLSLYESNGQQWALIHWNWNP